MHPRFRRACRCRPVWYQTQHLWFLFCRGKCVDSLHHQHKMQIHQAFASSKTSFYFCWLNWLGQTEDLIFTLDFWWMDCLQDLWFQCQCGRTCFSGRSNLNVHFIWNLDDSQFLARFLIRHHNPGWIVVVCQNKQVGI